MPHLEPEEEQTRPGYETVLRDLQQLPLTSERHLLRG